MHYNNKYSHNTTNSQVKCLICKAHFPDFKIPESGYYHLNCLNKCAESNPSYFDLSQYAYKDFLIKAPCCLICESKENLESCRNCVKIYCLNCALNPAKPVCCEPYRDFRRNTYKECIGCYYSKRVTEFCIQVKCEAHDYLCMKCWNLGKNVGKCILGCPINTNFTYYTECRICGQWKPKYLGEFRCASNCEICELCGYNRLINFYYTCPICKLSIERSN